MSLVIPHEALAVGVVGAGRVGGLTAVNGQKVVLAVILEISRYAILLLSYPVAGDIIGIIKFFFNLFSGTKEILYTL